MWITTREASKQTGYSEGYLTLLAREGRVKARKREGRWYFDSEVLLAYKDGWIGTRHASELTDHSESYLRSLAKKKQVLGRKVGGVWLFHRQDLLAGPEPGRPDEPTPRP
jgi:hypothetical protein